MQYNNIKALRLARGWSQEQLAALSALSVRTIQRIENGEQASIETMSALAAVFECQVAELMSQADERSEPAEEGADQRVLSANARLDEESGFLRSLFTWAVICGGLAVINLLTSHEILWFLWPLGIWGGLLLVRGCRVFVLHDWLVRRRQRRLQQLLRK